MPRTFALIDFDDTLILTIKNADGRVEEKLNTNIIKLLKDNHIEDIYLFTAASPLEVHGSSLNRSKVMQLLQQMGFTVYGAITLGDFFYRRRPGDFYTDFFQPCYDQDGNAKKLEVGVSTEYRMLKRKMKKYIDLIEQGDYEGHKNKRYMAEYFFECCPEECDSVILFDDNPKILSTVKTVFKEKNAQSKSVLQLLTIHCQPSINEEDKIGDGVTGSLCCPQPYRQASTDAATEILEFTSGVEAFRFLNILKQQIDAYPKKNLAPRLKDPGFIRYQKLSASLNSYIRHHATTYPATDKKHQDAAELND